MDEQTARAISAAVVKPVNEFAIWIAGRANEATTGEEIAVWVFVAARLSEMTEEIKLNLKQLKN